ncbi:MAG: zinc ribbon domain-containing protein [Solobacterium sp.]|nr:zinc ribbon domain-containing protein [Solobacterium sp.]
MFCTNCGKQVPDNNAFCPFCGTQLSSAKSSAIKTAGKGLQETAVHTVMPDVKEQEKKTDRPAEGRKGLPGWAMMIIGFALSAALFTGLIFGGVFRSGGANSSAVKYEGNGYDTPEEAVIAYAEALKAQDFDRMISTFAVESYCNNYDTLKAIGRQGVYSSYDFQTYPVAPAKNDLAVRTNIERRRAFLMNSVNRQMLTLAYASSGGHLYKLINSEPTTFEQGSEGEREMARFLEDLQYLPDLSKVEIGEIIYAETLVDTYLSIGTFNYFKRTAEVTGADSYKALALLFSVDGLEGFIYMDTARYNGKWYNMTPGGYIESSINPGFGFTGMAAVPDPGEFSDFSNLIAKQEQTLKELKSSLPEMKAEWEDEGNTVSFEEMLEFLSLTELTN